MIKKYLFFVLMSLMPAMLMAQAAGGTIKRPTKKKVTTTQSIRTNEKKNKKKESPNNNANPFRIKANRVSQIVTDLEYLSSIPDLSNKRKEENRITHKLQQMIADDPDHERQYDIVIHMLRRSRDSYQREQSILRQIEYDLREKFKQYEEKLK